MLKNSNEKKVMVLLFIVLIFTISKSVLALDDYSGNFRFGISYTNNIHSTIPSIYGDEEYYFCSAEGIGYNCEVYFPLKNIKRIHLLLGGVYINGKSFKEYLNTDANWEKVEMYNYSEIIGGYFGLRSSIGNKFGLEGSASIGYFAHRGTMEVTYSEGDLSQNISELAGSSLGGIFSVGPFIEFGNFNASINILIIGAGSETGIYTSSMSARLLIGTSFNM